MGSRGGRISVCKSLSASHVISAGPWNIHFRPVGPGGDCDNHIGTGLLLSATGLEYRPAFRTPLDVPSM